MSSVWSQWEQRIIYNTHHWVWQCLLWMQVMLFVEMKYIVAVFMYHLMTFPIKHHERKMVSCYTGMLFVIHMYYSRRDLLVHISISISMSECHDWCTTLNHCQFTFLKINNYLVACDTIFMKSNLHLWFSTGIANIALMYILIFPLSSISTPWQLRNTNDH